MKKISSMTIVVLFALLFFLSNSSIAFAGEIVEPSAAKILLNGAPYTFEAYTINQTNYFKLRDFASALKETTKCFDMNYDGSKQAIMLEKNKQYAEGNGSEVFTKGRITIAESNDASFFVDGKQVTLNALDIDQNTYFKLRDIMQILDISVDWSEQAQTISLDTAKPYAEPVALPLAGRTVCVDPGQGAMEAVPGQTKKTFSVATTGTQAWEAQVNLAVALKLRDQLKALGAQVLMTREDSASSGLTTVGALIANTTKVDMVVGVYCNGSTAKNSLEMRVLVPSDSYGNPGIAKASYEMGEAVLSSVLKATGASNGGVVAKEASPGFDCPTVPTILVEMGLITNPSEAKNLSTEELQHQLATGIATGITEYFRVGQVPAASQKLEKNNSPFAIRVENYMKKNPSLSQREALWKVKMNLDKREFAEARVLTKEELKSNFVIVNKRNKVPDGYTPDDLVEVTSRISLRAETKTAFDRMVADARAEGYKITPVSGYRTVAYQGNLYNRYLKTDSLANVESYSARAGFSEHHTGMAVDVAGSNNNMSNFGATKESVWVTKNAHKYGFIVRYLPDAKGVTGYKSEPWHLRYVGTDIAGKMKEQGIKTLEEYVGRFLL